MFDFVDVTALNSMLENTIHLYGFCPLAIVIQEIHKKGLF